MSFRHGNARRSVGGARGGDTLSEVRLVYRLAVDEDAVYAVVIRFDLHGVAAESDYTFDVISFLAVGIELMGIEYDYVAALILALFV